MALHENGDSGSETMASLRGATRVTRPTQLFLKTTDTAGRMAALGATGTCHWLIKYGYALGIKCLYP